MVKGKQNMNKKDLVIGTKYVISQTGGGHDFPLGTVVTYITDDGTFCPRFENAKGLKQYVYCLEVSEITEAHDLNKTYVGGTDFFKVKLVGDGTLAPKLCIDIEGHTLDRLVEAEDLIKVGKAFRAWGKAIRNVQRG
jgi:hypothetical protein